MRPSSLVTRAAIGAIGAVLTLTACGSGGGSADAVKAGPGVSAHTIRIGHLTDLSGPFGTVGKAFLDGAELFVKDRNAHGGVCGRDLELVVEDHGYDVQRAVTSYRKVKNDVIGIESILGGGMANALLPELTKDKQLASPLTWTSSLINGGNVFLTGATYEVQMVNAMSWAADNRGVQKGDTIGFVGLSGEVGEAVLAGVERVAEDRGLKVAKAFIAPTDTDFTGPISTLTKAHAKVVAVISTPPQLATLMSSADSASLDALWVGASPSIFSPSLLDGPAKQVLEDNLVIGSGQAPWAADSKAAQKVRDLYKKSGSKVAPQSSIMTGYAQAEIFAAVLEKACQDGDLTREGILKTFQSMDPVDTGGLVSTLDFTRGKGKSQSLETAILKPTSSVDGGLQQVQAAFTSDEVKNGGY